MKRFLIFVIAAILPLTAMAAKPDKARMVDNYMELANVKAAHGTMVKTVLDSIDTIHRQMGVEVNKLPREKQNEIRRIKSVVKTIFAADVFNKGVANFLSERLDEDQLERANQVLNDSMFRRISKLERQMIGKVDYNKLKAYHITLSVNPPSKQRMAYIGFMDQISESSEYASYLGQYIASMFTGSTLDREAVAQIDKAARDQITLTFLYYYRSLSDDDLKSYVQMMADDDVAWVIRQTMKAEMAVTVRAFDRLAEELIASAKRVGM